MSQELDVGLVSLNQARGHFSRYLEGLGLPVPSGGSFWRPGEKLSRSEACPVSLWAQGAISAMWVHCRDSLNQDDLGLRATSCGVGDRQFVDEPRDISEILESLKQDRSCRDISFAVLSELSRQTVCALEVALVRAINAGQILEVEHQAFKSEGMLRVNGGINTAASYVFGAALLIDRLLSETSYGWSEGDAKYLYEQAKRFFNAFSSSSGGLESAFQKECSATNYLEAKPHDPLNFLTSKFGVLQLERPVLAIKSDAIDRILSDPDSSNPMRLGCPALFAGILPEFLEWSTSVLDRFFWSSEARQRLAI